VAALHVLRVFTNEDGEWGNRLGVFLAGAEVPAAERQRVAADLGFSETVFVDDAASGELRIFTPQVEFPFAGHPLVGAAWLLEREGAHPSTLRPPVGEVPARVEGEMTFIAARPEWSPPFESVQLDDPAAVRELEGARHDEDDVYFWAWIDEAAGTIRARCFAPAVGIAEDEATGSAALALCDELDRPITVIQGNGSVLVACPLEDGLAEVGGRVALDEVRDYRLAS
jgi:predicted PhzF superfamily epimerase YddE/YHI9